MHGCAALCCRRSPGASSPLFYQTTGCQTKRVELLLAIFAINPECPHSPWRTVQTFASDFTASQGRTATFHEMLHCSMGCSMIHCPMAMVIGWLTVF